MGPPPEGDMAMGPDGEMGPPPEGDMAPPPDGGDPLFGADTAPPADAGMPPEDPMMGDTELPGDMAGSSTTDMPSPPEGMEGMDEMHTHMDDASAHGPGPEGDVAPPPEGDMPMDGDMAPPPPDDPAGDDVV